MKHKKNEYDQIEKNLILLKNKRHIRNHIMRFEENINLNSLNFPVLSFLDRFTPAYWAYRNELESLNIQPAKKSAMSKLAQKVTAVEKTSGSETMEKIAYTTYVDPAFIENIINEAKFMRSEISWEMLRVVVAKIKNLVGGSGSKGKVGQDKSNQIWVNRGEALGNKIKAMVGIARYIGRKITGSITVNVMELSRPPFSR